MRRDITSWYSHNLNMDMPLVAYGDSGYPLLMFPTAAADYLEYERFHLVDAIKDFIERNVITVEDGLGFATNQNNLLLSLKGLTSGEDYMRSQGRNMVPDQASQLPAGFSFTE